jgi:hypothetical protein
MCEKRIHRYRVTLLCEHEGQRFPFTTEQQAINRDVAAEQATSHAHGQGVTVIEVKCIEGRLD